MTDDVRPAPLPPVGTDADVVDHAVRAEQRGFLRRILIAFVVVVVVLLPLAGLQGAMAWVLLPALAAAAFGLREAIRLRRSVRRFGAPR